MLLRKVLLGVLWLVLGCVGRQIASGRGLEL